MATTLYLRTGAPGKWTSGAAADSFFSVKDSSRAVTTGDDTYTRSLGSATAALSTTVGTGAGTSISVTTVTGPTAGKRLGTTTAFFTDPIAADVTISGTVNLAFCGSESSMGANATFVVQLYRVDAEGAWTQIISSSLGTELGTSLARSSWSGSPTSTAVKQGDRLALVVLADDATSVTMGSGFSVSCQYNGANASTADSNLVLTENLTFITSDPAGSTYYLRDTASDISGAKALSTTQGSGTAEAVHQTIAGAITFPGDQWTATAGGSDIEWFTPTLNAFTLGGLVKVILNNNAAVLEAGAATPFDALTIEIARVDSDGSNASVWTRSYTGSGGAGGIDRYLSGPDLSIAQGQRLRFRVYSDDCWSDTQLSGTNRTIRYDGTSTYASRLIFTQTITEGVATKSPPYPLHPPHPMLHFLVR
jgi:hypothetical protein